MFICNVNFQDLSGGGFGQASHFRVLAVDPSAELAQHIHALKSFENVALFSSLRAFSVTAMSSHLLSNFRDETGWGRFCLSGIFMDFVSIFEVIFFRACFWACWAGTALRDVPYLALFTHACHMYS